MCNVFETGSNVLYTRSISEGLVDGFWEKEFDKTVKQVADSGVHATAPNINPHAYTIGHRDNFLLVMAPSSSSLVVVG
jgi:hypothetical protein